MKKIQLANAIILSEVVNLVNTGCEVTLKVKGSSMLPFIVGSRDSVILIKEENYKIGDIVLALINGETYVVHRIIKMTDSEVVLMGDGNSIGVERCTLSDIKAKAIKIIRKGIEVDCYTKAECRKWRIWRNILPFRAYILAILRRTIYKQSK